jgi:tetratricopeptide (TPR) repeat protein
MKNLFLVLLLLSHVSGFCQPLVKAADSLLLNADYAGALRLIEASENTLPVEHRNLAGNRKARALIHLGKFDEAEQLLKDIQHRSDTEFVKGINLTTFGFLYLNQGRNDRALEVLQQAIVAFENDGKAKSLESAQALTYLGNVYKFTGKHAQAQEQLLMALSYRQNILKENHELIAASYNDLGLSYARIDNDKALDYYEKALKIYQALHGNEHAKIAITNINTGIVYRDLELYGDAVNNFETALKIWEKIYSKANPAKAFALLNLGDTYRRMGNQKSAKGYYERSLNMYKESYGNKHPETAQVLNAMGTLELDEEKFDLGLNYYQQALIANVRDFENPEVSVNPQLRNYYHGSLLLNSLLFKARAFEKRYFGKSLKLGDLTNSLATLQYCDSLIDKLRQQSTNESDKIGLGVIANEVYTDGVRIAFETSQNAVRKKPYLDLAFYFAEKNNNSRNTSI